MVLPEEVGEGGVVLPRDDMCASTFAARASSRASTQRGRTSAAQFHANTDLCNEGSRVRAGSWKTGDVACKSELIGWDVKTGAHLASKVKISTIPSPLPSL